MAENPRFWNLTSREVEVLQAVAEGGTNWNIGHSLHISEETVKSHIRHILAKIDTSSRTHAVALAIRAGVIA